MPITFDHEQATARIREVWGQATYADIDAGMGWYRDTYEHARMLARRKRTTITPVVGIMAALSPGVSYERSITLAEAMLDMGDAAHPYGDAIRKARRIRGGEPPLTVLGGRKVRAFYDNIRHPNTSEHVTIDRHAYAITVAEEFGPRGGARIRYQDLQRKGAYEAVAQAYRAAAEHVGIMPHQMQAITWITWRGDSR